MKFILLAFNVIADIYVHSYVTLFLFTIYFIKSNLFFSFLPPIQFRSVAQSCPTLCSPMDRSTRPPCPSPIPGVHPNTCPLCQWCHPTISSSVIPFSSCLQSFPASGSFQMSQLSTSGGLVLEFQLQHQSLQ